MREFLNGKSKIKYALLVLSAFLTALTLMIPSIGFLEWLTLIPAAVAFILTAEDGTIGYKRMYLYGFVYYMGFGLSIFHWFINLYPLEFIDMSKAEAAVVVAVAWFGLSLLQAVFAAFMPVVLAFLIRRTAAGRSRFFLPLAAASLYTVFEWMQTLTWAGVPWGRLALGQTEMPVILTASSVLGSYFITFAVVAVNYFLAMVILAGKEERRGVYLSAATGILALTIGMGGAVMLFGEKDGERFTAAAIQVNSSSHEKWKPGQLEITMSVLEEYSMAAAEEGASLIVWPETVFPTYPIDRTMIRNFMTDLAVRCDATIVVGGFTEGEGMDKNSLIFVHPDGRVDETVYSKRHLVPFGEYVPMRKIIMTLIPPLAEISMLGEDLAPGEDSAVVDTREGRLGGLVCFDSIYELLSLDSVRDGAQVLVLGTNDSWFLDSAAVYMHNSQAKLRAAETGRYIVRAANTGISSIIDPHGRVLDEEPPLVGGYVVGEVAKRSAPTVYSVVGNLFVYVCIACQLLLAAHGTAVILREIRGQKSKKSLDKNA